MTASLVKYLGLQMIRKTVSKLITTLNKELLERDLDKLSNWTRDWQMKFSVEKCSHAHTYQ